MNERILKLLSLCIQAKGKGHDCFFYYSPHVSSIQIDIHKGGWKAPDADANGNVVPRTDNMTKSFQFEINDQKKAVKAGAYLKGLIKWQAQD